MKKIYLGMLFFFCFFIFSLNPKAEVIKNLNYYITYNYNSSYVLNTANSKFKGNNGYLEIIRKYFESKSADSYVYEVYFTRNDIIVMKHFQASNNNYVFLYNLDDNITYLSLVFQGKTLHLRLSEFENFDSFYTAILNNNYIETNHYSILVNSKHGNINIPIDSNYNYFTSSLKDSYDYIIPYYGKDSLYMQHYFRFNPDGFYSVPVLSKKYYIYKPVVNGSSGVVKSSYYSEFGVFGEENNTSNYLYDVSVLIDKSNFDSFTSQFSWNCQELPEIMDLTVYAKVDNGQSYSWKDIKYKTGSTSYYSPDYTDVTYDNGKCSMSIIHGTYSGLTNFEKIYISFHFTPSKSRNTYGYSIKSNNVEKSYFNDLHQYFIIENKTITNDDVYFFSTRDVLYNDYFFFSKLPKQYLPYLEVNLYDYDKKVNTQEINYLESSNVNSVLYLDIIKLKTQTFGSSNKTGLYFNVGEDPTGQLYEIIFSYNPKNVLISHGEIDSSRDKFSVDIIDENGNIITDIIYGDYDYNSSIDIGLLSLFKSAYEGSKTFVNCGIEILSLVTDFFNFLPIEVQCFLILLFILMMLVIFLKSVM